MRLVFDTDVLLSGLRSAKGASRVLLIAASEGAVTALASVPMMVEYESVLKRDEHLVAMGLSADEVDRFLDQWAVLVEAIPVHYSWRPSIADPDDEIFVEAALNGAADAIVTFNARDYRPADRAQAALGIEILRPGDVLRRLQWRP
jgi:putative PIN family toxin of toxin-antitoxin system